MRLPISKSFRARRLASEKNVVPIIRPPGFRQRAISLTAPSEMVDHMKATVGEEEVGLGLGKRQRRHIGGDDLNLLKRTLSRARRSARLSIFGHRSPAM